MAVNPNYWTQPINNPPVHQIPTSPINQPRPAPVQQPVPSPSDPFAGYSDDLKAVLNGQLMNVNNQLSAADQLRLYRAIAGAPRDVGNHIRSQYLAHDAVQQSAYDEMVSALGREPTTDEYSQLVQAFQGPNWAVNGRAAVSQYAQQIKSDPNNPNSPANPHNAGYQDYLAPYTGSVSEQYQSILGRAPTSDELQHFSSILASGQSDAYGLQNYLKQLPEYTNAQDAQFRTGLNDELAGYDQKAFGREKNDIMADYARRGFGVGNSPSLDYALTDLMGKIAENRGGFLANLSAQQYGGNKQLAVGNYQNSLNQMYDQNQANRQRQNQLTDSYMNRGYEGADYLTQKNDYMNYLNSQKKRGNPWGQLIGGAIGAGAGAYFGGPQGAQAGYGVGSGLGGSYDYLNY